MKYASCLIIDVFLREEHLAELIVHHWTEKNMKTIQHVFKDVIQVLHLILR